MCLFVSCLKEMTKGIKYIYMPKPFASLPRLSRESTEERMGRCAPAVISMPEHEALRLLQLWSGRFGVKRGSKWACRFAMKAG